MTAQAAVTRRRLIPLDYLSVALSGRITIRAE
jgi:hypothetical protein